MIDTLEISVSTSPRRVVVEEAVKKMVHAYAKIFPEGYMVLQSFELDSQHAHIPYLQHPVFGEIPLEQTLDIYAAAGDNTCSGSVLVYRKTIRESLEELNKFYF